jgi:hypothetical protein
VLGSTAVGPHHGILGWTLPLLAVPVGVTALWLSGRRQRKKLEGLAAQLPPGTVDAGGR